MKRLLLVLNILLSHTLFCQEKGNCAEYANKKAERKFRKMRDFDYPMDRSGTIYQMKELVDRYNGYPELIAFIAGHYQESSYKTMSPGIKENVRDSAKKWFTKLSETCPAYQGHLAYYWLGRMNHEEGNDSVAAFYFKDYLNNESEPPREYKKIATQLKNEFFIKKQLLSNPVDFSPRNVKGVSTEHDEYLPMLSPDNEWAYFTRKRNTKRNIKLPPGTPVNNGREYFTRSKTMSIDSFSRGMALNKPFNMHMQPLLDVGSNNKLKGLGGACLTPDNKTMYLTANLLIIPLVGGGYDNTELMKTNYKNGQWGPLKSVGSLNNEEGQPTWEGQPTISSDGNLMVFTSARLSSTSVGEDEDETFTLDLFYSTKNENGRWGSPKNLGPLVNSKGQEKTPFLHTDSKTLYFSSNGHPGVGGYDIYFTRMDKNGNWIKPKNIGFPINTEEDEHGLIVSLDGKTAYFTRGEQGVAETGGLDLVSFGLHKNARPEKVVMMKGNLKDENGKPVKNGKISVTDKTTGEVHKGLVDQETGEYVVVMAIKDPNKKEIEPEKVTLIVNGEDIEADYGSQIKKIGKKEVIVPPGGEIVSVNNVEKVIAKDERIVEINGQDKVIKKSDKIREVNGLNVVVSSDYEVVDVGGLQKVVQRKQEEKEKQRFIISASGDEKAFSTKVLEINPNQIDGAKKVYAKEPIKIETLAKNKPIRLNELNFSTNSFVLNGESMDILDELVIYLKLKSSMYIEIHGHTDNIGDAKKNQILSQNRAESVMKFLVSNGISQKRLSSKGFGQAKPNKSNNSKRGRAFNRRVEFVVKEL